MLLSTRVSIQDEARLYAVGVGHSKYKFKPSFQCVCVEGARCSVEVLIGSNVHRSVAVVDQPVMVFSTAA